MTQLQLGATTAVATSAIVLLLTRWLIGWRYVQHRRASSLHAVQRSVRAHRGEQDAESLLVAHGFRILVRQPRAVWAPQVDNVAMPFDLRADLLVQDMVTHEVLIAEVKTGDFAPALTTAATRRQLLEYQLAFAVNAILLVTPERGDIARVQFSMPTPAILDNVTTTRTWRSYHVLAAMAIALALILIDLSNACRGT
jgi:hypothetical protein